LKEFLSVRKVLERAKGAAAQGGQLDFIELGVRDGVQIVFGHVSTSAGEAPGGRPYNVGSSRGRGPRGKAASISFKSASLRWRSPAPAFSAACAGLEALGMTKTEGRRTTNRSATWRAVAWCSAAISASSRPPGGSGPGDVPWPNGL